MMVSRALVSATLLFLGTACSNGSTAPKGESDSGPTFSDYTVYTDRSVPAAANDQALVDKGTPARDQGCRDAIRRCRRATKHPRCATKRRRRATKRRCRATKRRRRAIKRYRRIKELSTSSNPHRASRSI
jgi:hypothetical protein